MVYSIIHMADRNAIIPHIMSINNSYHLINYKSAYPAVAMWLCSFHCSEQRVTNFYLYFLIIFIYFTDGWSFSFFCMRCRQGQKYYNKSGNLFIMEGERDKRREYEAVKLCVRRRHLMQCREIYKKWNINMTFIKCESYILYQYYLHANVTFHIYIAICECIIAIITEMVFIHIHGMWILFETLLLLSSAGIRF